MSIGFRPQSDPITILRRSCCHPPGHRADLPVTGDEAIGASCYATVHRSRRSAVVNVHGPMRILGLTSLALALLAACAPPIAPSRTDQPLTIAPTSGNSNRISARPEARPKDVNRVS